MMNIDLTGQSAVVTGASRGIGLAVTRSLTAGGAHVIAGAPHSPAELDKRAAEGTVTALRRPLQVLAAEQRPPPWTGGAGR
jgi:NAD(P)-dependent dehydrogenase (short-subunit alcohol dehydrogenase family)